MQHTPHIVSEIWNLFIGSAFIDSISYSPSDFLVQPVLHHPTIKPRLALISAVIEVIIPVSVYTFF